MISFVVDNRSVPYQRFQTEAAYASFFRNVTAFIGKFCSVSKEYRWVKFPSNFSIALSPDKVRLLKQSEWDISRLNNVMESRYSSGRPLQKITWGHYMCDAIKKITELPANNREQHHNIVVFSSDFCLLGDTIAHDMDEGLDRFCAAAVKFRDRWPNGRILILCAIVSETTHTDQYYASPNLVKVQRKLQAVSDVVFFRGVKNAQVSFDAELHCLLSSLAQPLHATLNLPAQHGGEANCSLVLALHAATCAAQEELHDGLCAPVFVALVPRTGVDAAYLEGSGLFVQCPHLTAAADMLPTENRQANKLHSLDYCLLLFFTSAKM